MFFGFGTQSQGEVIIVAALFYNGSDAKARAVYGSLLDIDGILVNTTAVMTYAVSNTFLNSGLGHGLRRSMKGSAFRAPLDLGFAQSVSLSNYLPNLASYRNFKMSPFPIQLTTSECLVYNF
jgi:hypothetical protein